MAERLNLLPYKQELIARYEAGEAPTKMTNIPACAVTIAKNLKAWGIPMRRVGEDNIKNIDSYRGEIVMRYLAGESVGDIAATNPFSHSIVHARLMEWEIPLRTPLTKRKPLSNDLSDGIQFVSRWVQGTGSRRKASDGSRKIRGRGNRRVYQVKHDAFDDFSDERTAYFAGYMAADGCVSRYGDAASWTISLSSKDIDILEKFRLFVCPNQDKPIYKPDRGTRRFTITSLPIGERLVGAGITPRKSLTLSISDPVLSSSRHFFRGLFDGDGCISKSNNTRVCSLVSGSSAMMTQFVEFVEQSDCIPGNRYLVRGKYHVYHLAGKKIFPFLDLLYGDASIYLDRKYEKAMMLLNYGG